MATLNIGKTSSENSPSGSEDQISNSLDPGPGSEDQISNGLDLGPGSENQVSNGLDPGPENMEMKNMNSTAPSSLCK